MFRIKHQTRDVLFRHPRQLHGEHGLQLHQMQETFWFLIAKKKIEYTVREYKLKSYSTLADLHNAIELCMIQRCHKIYAKFYFIVRNLSSSVTT